jgi:indole-3-glycerol phosphate synthase
LPRRSLKAALISRSPAVIAEIKRASPSKGMIRAECDPGAIALSYVRAGAAAVSVLTDEPFFKGSIDYLLKAREGHAAPILRKDFIIDSYQLSEARAYGADAVLLIVAVLGGDRLFELKEEAERLGLETLVEVHNERELEELEDGVVEVLGINNRDLSSFSTTLEVTPACGLGSRGDGHCERVRHTDSADLQLLEEHGVHAVLVVKHLCVRMIGLRCGFLRGRRCRMKIKICGITRAADAMAAVQCGADAMVSSFSIKPASHPGGGCGDCRCLLPAVLCRCL